MLEIVMSWTQCTEIRKMVQDVLRKCSSFLIADIQYMYDAGKQTDFI